MAHIDVRPYNPRKASASYPLPGIDTSVDDGNAPWGQSFNLASEMKLPQSFPKLNTWEVHRAILLVYSLFYFVKHF